jgi:hypothetical protein
VSVYVTTYVWEHSAQKGTDLLLMLAIADVANRGGVAWPSVRTLAAYIRMSERNTQRVLSRLVATGELMLDPNAGPKGCHLYRVRMDRSLSLFREDEGDTHVMGDNLSPPDNWGGEGVTNRTKRGDTAMSPEPSGTISKPVNLGRGAEAPPPEERPTQSKERESAQSPVAKAFQTYAAGIKAKYGADYPASAKANGQLSQVVGRIGAEPTAAVIGFYLTHRDPFYGKVKHALGYLVRDCERLWMEFQVATGDRGAAKPATVARVELLYENGSSRTLEDEQPGQSETIARQSIRKYARMVANTRPKNVRVTQGASSATFTIAELTEPSHNNRTTH